MDACSIYFISQRAKGYPDESFYNEYDFICHARLESNSISNSSQIDCLQAETLLHRES